MPALRLIIFGIVLLAASVTLRAQLTYLVHDLGTLGGSTSSGNAVNENGQVTGDADLLDDTTRNAFISDADRTSPLRDLGTLSGTGSSGQAIDSSGRVAGSSRIEGDLYFRAFLSEPNGGALIDLGTLGGLNSYGHGVNGAGQVAGYSLTTGNSTTHAFLSGEGGGTLHDLGTLPGGTNSFAQDVNASGQVAGYSGSATGFNHAFISEISGGALQDLGTLGGRFSFGTAVNDSGQVTGRSETTAFFQHAFRSGPNGGPLLDLGTLGGFSSFGQAINGAGDVVGYSYLSDNSTQHAFLYTTAMGMIDLNAHLMSGSGWTLIEARGINDRGQITGFGTVGGQTRGFLLTLAPSDFRITSITVQDTGRALIKGIGTPSQPYSVQACEDIRGPFVQIATIVAASDGTLQYEDVDAANFAQRFYRFVAL